MSNMKWIKTVALASLFTYFVLTAAGCSSNKNAKSIVTVDDQYSHALRLYNEEEYGKARVEFQKLIFNYPSSPLVIESKFYLADCYYLDDDYLLAANEFKRFSEDYPQSQLAPIALFKAGESYFKLSKRPELTQDETKQALDTFQLLVIKYPGNSIVEKAQKGIQKCYDKLARKEYLNAKFYYRYNFWDAALLYLEPILQKYPDATVTPGVLYLLAGSYEGMDQKEKAQDTREQLVHKYPDSAETKKLLREFPGLLDQVRNSGN